MVTEDRIVRPGEVERKEIDLVTFLANHGLRSSRKLFRAVRRARVLAGLSSLEREYIRKRVYEIRCDDAFVIPVTAYKLLHTRWCNTSAMGGSCSEGGCIGKQLTEKCDAIIKDVYGTRQEILRG